MEISVVSIGNSRGIRIPKSILEQLHITNRVDMLIKDNSIILQPLNRNPREGWNEAFQTMSNSGDDKLLALDFNEKEEFEWEW